MMENEKNYCNCAAREIDPRADVMPQPKPPSFRERLRMQMAAAMEASGRLQALDELAYLLEKHPEVARILDLVDEVGK